ncbi:MAG: amidohydrolase [Planctomycetes bacterium]|nr:amidohydrolase [Planctomycetota bacterium]
MGDDPTAFQSAAGRIDAVLPEILDIRRRLHAHPELAYEEFRTTALLEEHLRGWGYQTKRHLPTGVAAFRDAGGRPRVALRADIDALPVEEPADHDPRSEVPGRMHACGHDGHMAAVLGVAKLLASERPPFDVAFVFQPAEEMSLGADRLCRAGLLEDLGIERIYAFHNWPTLAEGHLAVRPGPLLASQDTLRLTFAGIGGHASAPDLAVDPIVMAARFVMAAQTVVSREMSAHERAVISITKVHAGEADNIIPERADLVASIRTLEARIRAMIPERLRALAEGIAASARGRAEFSYEFIYPVTVNPPAEAERIARVARTVLGPERVHTDLPPSMGSEDFACYLERIPGCFFFIGGGVAPRSPGDLLCDDPFLHRPAYRFREAIIPKAMRLFLAILEDIARGRA